MAKQDKSKIKDWFRTGKYPTQEQFWDWMDSYIHRDDKLDIAVFPELDGILRQKIDKVAFQYHLDHVNNPHQVTKVQIGLGNVDDTADMDKPISLATQNALDLKADKTHLEDVSNPHKVTKQQVGLGDVDNTADLDKPISRATQAALYEKANHTHIHDIDTLEGFDTDVTLTANSDEKVASQKAVKTYVDKLVKSLVDDSSELLEGLKEFSKAIDNDATLAANGDKKIASQKAVKTYVDAANVALQNRIAKLEKSQLIPGMIMAWKGSVDAIPAGWKLCEELKGRFILGANDEYPVGKKDGAAKHQLTIDEMPEHSHHYTTSEYASTVSTDNKGRGKGLWSLVDAQSYPVTKTGGNKAHNNMPPYYALAYIEYVGFGDTTA
jgi:hypothetical protein